MKHEDVQSVTNLSIELSYRNPDWREGQCLFNALYALHPDVADDLRGKNIDPFYNNEKISAMWDYIFNKHIIE